MLVNAPHLPNISAIADTSRGKRSVLLDLNDIDARDIFKGLIADAHIFVQGYRPGGLRDLGFSPQDLAELASGIVCVSLSAYGGQGPWANRRGFDSLVQTACGFNLAEAQAFADRLPRSLPVPILDFASGFLMAFGAQAALLKQQQEGGSWHVEVSLLQTANWLRRMGRRPLDESSQRLDLSAAALEYPCRFGILRAMPHAADFSGTPAGWIRPSSLPGDDAPAW